MLLHGGLLHMLVFLNKVKKNPTSSTPLHLLYINGPLPKSSVKKS